MFVSLIWRTGSTAHPRYAYRLETKTGIYDKGPRCRRKSSVKFLVLQSICWLRVGVGEVKSRLHVVIAAAAFFVLAVDGSAIELPACGSHNLYRVGEHELSRRSFLPCCNEVFGKRAEEWADEDFATVKSWSQGCLSKLCEKPKSIVCNTAKRSHTKILKSLESAAVWVEGARKEAAERAARRAHIERSKRLLVLEYESAVSFLTSAISQMKGLPGEKSSVTVIKGLESEVKRIQRDILERRDELRAVQARSMYDDQGIEQTDARFWQLVRKFEDVTDRRRRSLKAVMSRKNCAAEVFKTGLPESNYKKAVWFIEGRVLHAEIDLLTLVCGIGRMPRVSSITYASTQGGRHSINATTVSGGSIRVTLTKMRGTEAWTLTHLYVNGRGGPVSQIEALRFLALLPLG